MLGVQLLGVRVLSDQRKVAIIRKASKHLSTITIGGRAKIRAAFKLLKQSFLARLAAAFIRRQILRRTGQAQFKDRALYTYPKGFDSKTQIHILRLRRTVPFMDLEADFIYHALEDELQYDAISYVWGSDTEKNFPLILHGKQFLVTRNVHNILQSMSSWFGDRFIWIDSACIDQADTYNEKRHQIPKMVDIYRAAVGVHVCLQGPDDAWLAGSFLQEILFQNDVMPQMIDALALEAAYT